MTHEMRRELALYGGLAVAFGISLAGMVVLDRLVSNARGYVEEVREIKDLQGQPPPEFSLSWETKSGMLATQLNPRMRAESVLEHVERTIADVNQALQSVPQKE
jgi:hypothetical protein